MNQMTCGELARLVVVGSFVDLDLSQVPVQFHRLFTTAQDKLNRIITSSKRVVAMDQDDVLIGLRITVKVTLMDGTGGVLGISGPTHVLADDGLPVLGVMEFDNADLSNLTRKGQADGVVLHEMLRVAGFGTLWEYKDLLSGAGLYQPEYQGVQACAVYRGMQPHADTVPAEQAADDSGLWSVDVFGSEVMTGWVGAGARPVSAVTIAALADLGYEVDYTAADEFALPTAAGCADFVVTAAPQSFETPPLTVVRALPHRV